jgi:hypothetical protein
MCVCFALVLNIPIYFLSTLGVTFLSFFEFSALSAPLFVFAIRESLTPHKRSLYGAPPGIWPITPGIWPITPAFGGLHVSIVRASRVINCKRQGRSIHRLIALECLKLLAALDGPYKAVPCVGVHRESAGPSRIIGPAYEMSFRRRYGTPQWCYGNPFSPR